MSDWERPIEVLSSSGVKELRRLQAENAKLRELVRIAGTYCVNGYCDPDDGCPLLVDGKCQLTDRMRELGIEVD